MDWTKIIEWGIAGGAVFQASRKMDEFKAMFQETLSKLTAQAETHGKDIEALKAQSTETNQAVVGLAGIVASMIVDDDEVDGEPGPIN